MKLETMDFLDPEKRRAHLVKLYIGYFLVAVAIAMGSLILLFQSFGYDVNHQTGQVFQNGLVFVSARPTPANIYLNGQLNKSKTDTKLTIPAGQYALELRRDGYQTWKRTFNLEGGSVERFTYPLLVPVKLALSDVQLYASQPSFASLSLDHHWLIVQQPGSISTFDDYDLTNYRQTPAVINLPADLMTVSTADQQLTAVAWAGDNRHLLIKHIFGDASEYIIIDRETPANSININRLIGQNPTTVTLRDKKYDQLYIFDAKTQTLQTYDLKVKVLTALLEKVISYKTRGPSQVLYVTESGIVPNKTVVMLWDGNTSYPVHDFTAKTDIAIDIAQYNGDSYVVVAPRIDGHVYVYKNPLDSLKLAKPKLLVPITILKIGKVDNISFSETAHFIVVQNSSKFASYDIESDRRYYYEIKQSVTSNLTAGWIDDFHLTQNIGGKVVLFDFDGSNQQVLSSTIGSFPPYFDKDYTGLYNIAPSTVVPSRFALTRTELKIP